MNKNTLIAELRMSLPSRMLEVVNIGAVKVGAELIILKQRPRYDVVEEDMVTYSERHYMHHDYKELIAKNVIFDSSLINHRGKEAIKNYLNNLSDEKTMKGILNIDHTLLFLLDEEVEIDAVNIAISSSIEENGLISFRKGDEVEVLKTVFDEGFLSKVAYVIFNPKNNESLTVDSSTVDLL